MVLNNGFEDFTLELDFTIYSDNKMIATRKIVKI